MWSMGWAVVFVASAIANFLPCNHKDFKFLYNTSIMCRPRTFFITCMSILKHNATCSSFDFAIKVRRQQSAWHKLWLSVVWNGEKWVFASFLFQILHYFGFLWLPSKKAESNIQYDFETGMRKKIKWWTIKTIKSQNYWTNSRLLEIWFALKVSLLRKIFV